MNPQIVNTICEYFKSKPVDRAWVFGSFSRGEEKENSDIDIIVALSPDARMGLSYYGMICDLEDRLHRPVDMVREGQLLPFAVESANRDKILIYERDQVCLCFLCFPINLHEVKGPDAMIFFF